MPRLPRRWLQDRLPQEVQQRCYFFNTFFFKKLTEEQGGLGWAGFGLACHSNRSASPVGRHVSTSQHPRSMQCSCCTLGGHACVCMCRRRAAAGGGGVGQAGGDQGAKAAGAAQPPEGQEVDQGALPGWRWGPVLCRSPTADGSRQRVAGCFSGSGVPATHDAPSHTTRACHRACTSSHTACTLLTLSPVPTPRRMWTCLRRTTSLFRSTRRCTGASWWSATQVGQPAAGLSAGTGARQGVAEGTPSSCVAAACVPRISGMPPNDCCAAGGGVAARHGADPARGQDSLHPSPGFSVGWVRRGHAPALARAWTARAVCVVLWQALLLLLLHRAACGKAAGGCTRGAAVQMCGCLPACRCRQPQEPHDGQPAAPLPPV